MVKQLRVPLKLPNTMVLWWSEDFQRALNTVIRLIAVIFRVRVYNLSYALSTKLNTVLLKAKYGSSKNKQQVSVLRRACTIFLPTRAFPIQTDINRRCQIFNCILETL